MSDDQGHRGQPIMSEQCVDGTIVSFEAARTTWDSQS